MIADLVRNMGGDRVEVTALMGPGVDPHLYKPSAGDVDVLSEADSSSTAACTWRGAWAICSRAWRVRQAHPRRHGGHPGRGTDRHQRRARPARLVRRRASGSRRWTKWSRRLSRDRPGAAPTLPGERRRLPAELDALDAYVREQADARPRSAAGAGHRARRLRLLRPAYGFEVRGLQGISTAAEAGAGDVQAAGRLHRRARRCRRSSSSPACRRPTIEAVQDGGRRPRGCDVRVGGAAVLRRDGPARARPRAPTSAWCGTTSTRSWRHCAVNRQVSDERHRPDGTTDDDASRLPSTSTT